MRLFKIILFLGIVIGFICCAQDIEVGYKFLEKTHTVQLGARDILFVLDTSCTMKEEHGRLLNGFGEFINTFLAELRLDWRLGILTMNIDDQGLLEFSNGAYFLDSNTENYEAYFQTAVSNTLSHCPPQNGLGSSSESGGNPQSQSPSSRSLNSDDERGIYAVNNLLESDPHGFLRANTRLAVVFISDEDVRSGLYKTDQLELEEKDKPETLILNIREKLGSKILVSFHSIIVLPQAENQDEDQAKDRNFESCCGKSLTFCLCKQLEDKYGPDCVGASKNTTDPNYNQLFNLFYLIPSLFEGAMYYKLSQSSRIDDEDSLLHLGSIVSGTVESICSDNYQSFYKNLADNLEERIVNIPCKGRKIEAVLVQTHDDREPLVEGLDYIIDRDRGVVKFQPNVRSDREITVESKCFR